MFFNNFKIKNVLFSVMLPLKKKYNRVTDQSFFEVVSRQTFYIVAQQYDVISSC